MDMDNANANCLSMIAASFSSWSADNSLRWRRSRSSVARVDLAFKAFAFASQATTMASFTAFSEALSSYANACEICAREAVCASPC